MFSAPIDCERGICITVVSLSVMWQNKVTVRNLFHMGAYIYYSTVLYICARGAVCMSIAPKRGTRRVQSLTRHICGIYVQIWIRKCNVCCISYVSMTNIHLFGGTTKIHKASPYFG
jgi:hypothetical protein